MKQEVYNDYKISVDGNDGKFVIVSIENKQNDKLDSENKNKEFPSEDEAINAAKAEIDKKAENKETETVETKEETETVTQSAFDKLFNQILSQNSLVDDWNKLNAKKMDEVVKVAPVDTGFEGNPEIDGGAEGAVEEQQEQQEEK